MLTLPQATDQIGRYQILSELGRGSMGQVYLALDPNIDRHVALKVYLPLLKVGSRERYELRRRFILEAKAAGRVEHPGIVTIFDADTDPVTDLSYIAMEWVEGRSLQEMLAEDGPVPPGRTIEIIGQVAVALEAAHRQGLVHRDVKPGNILCGLDGVIKVTDFGIAKLASMSLTHTGWIPGSPFYMSPEQIRNEHVDHRSDIYSLGAVLYECLTGVVPFEGDSLASLTYMILEIDPRPPQTLDPRIDDTLAGVAMRALSKSPADRFQSALEMAKALRGQIPIEPMRPHPARSGTVGIVSNSTGITQPLPTLPSDGTTGLTDAETAPAPSHPPVASERRLPIVGWLLVLLLVAAGAVALRFAPWRAEAEPPERIPMARVARVSQPAGFAPAGVRDSVSGGLAADEMSPPAVEPAPEPETELEAPAPARPSPRSQPAARRAPAATPPVPSESREIPESQPEPTPVAETLPPAETEAEAQAETEAPMEQAQLSEPQSLELDTTSLTREFAERPPAAAYGTLEIVFRNRLKGGTLSVWIDEDRAWTHSFAGSKNFLKRSLGKDVWTTVPIPAGTRLIDVRLTGVEGKLDLVRQAEISIEGGQTRRVRVIYQPPKTLKLSWKDQEDG
jgi:serine/threonine-protein kinase